MSPSSTTAPTTSGGRAERPTLSEEARPLANAGLKAIPTLRPASAASTAFRAWPTTMTTGLALDASVVSATIRTIGWPSSFATSFVASEPPPARKRADCPAASTTAPTPVNLKREAVGARRFP